MAVINTSSMSEWYKRLNAVRVLVGLSSVTAPTISSGSIILASQPTTLQTDITSSKTASTYLTYATYQDVSVSSGSVVLTSQADSFNQTLTSMEKICPNRSVTTNSTYSDNSKNANDSDCSTKDTTTGNSVSYNTTNSEDSVGSNWTTLDKRKDSDQSNSTNTTYSKDSDNSNHSNKSGSDSVNANYSVANNSVNSIGV